MSRILTIEISEQAYIAAMALSEINGVSIDKFIETKVCEDELIDL